MKSKQKTNPTEHVSAYKYDWTKGNKSVSGNRVFNRVHHALLM